MINTEKIVKTFNAGTFKAFFDVMKKDYLNDMDSTEYTMMRYLEKCDEEDLIEIFKKTFKNPIVSLNLTFYDIVSCYPPKLTYFLYENEKIGTYNSFPEFLFFNCSGKDKNNNESKVYELFRAKGFFDLNIESSIIINDLIKSRSVQSFLRIENSFKKDMSKAFLKIENSINNQNEMHLYIDDWSDEEKLNSYKINTKTLLERIVENKKVNLLNEESLEILINEKCIDFSELSQENVDFIFQLDFRTLSSLIQKNTNIKKLNDYSNSINERNKINEKLNSENIISINLKKRL